MKKTTITINLLPSVKEIFQEQAALKGMDMGAYLTHLVHTQVKRNDIESQIQSIFLKMLETEVKGDE